jgi:putative CocE/NonD family hydrolase
MNPLSRLRGALVDRGLGLPSQATAYTIRSDVPVRMADGAVLLGDHYRPVESGGPLPVVLLRSPYGRAGLVGAVFAAPLARRGFQVFIQSTRGTFGSGGQFRPFTTEKEDGLATVAWIRDQAWCDGRISTVGASYLGHTQWAIAGYVDPPLESASLNVTAARMSIAFYPHGAPGLQNALVWAATIGNQERGGLPYAVPTPRKSLRMRRALRKLPLQAADVEVAGAPVAYWRDFVGHAGPGDPFWSGADHDDTDLTRLPPVSMVTGWWDLFLPGQLRDYAAIRAAGGTVRLTIGPWQHGELGELQAGMQEDLNWLDHHLNGAPAPTGAPVRVLLQQTATWLDLESWPPAGARPVRYYLEAGQQLTARHPPEAVGPGSESASQEFLYDPSGPTPTVGGPLLMASGKQGDNAEVESRPDVLIYTSRPSASDLDVVGPVSARIFVRTDHPYADVFVRVCDVDPKGTSRNVVDGIRRLDPATVPADDVEVGADGVLAVDVELFPTAYRIRAGHRVRVQVSGGAFPRFARNLGTGEPFGAATAMAPNRFRIFHDAGHPSHVDLPVLPRPDRAAGPDQGRPGSKHYGWKR